MQPVVSQLMEACPTCGSQLSRVKYAEIQAKVSAEEERRRRQAKVEVERLLFEERAKLAAEREAFQAKSRAEKEALQKENEVQREALQAARELVEKTRAEKAGVEKKAKEQAEAAVATARKQLEAELSKKAASEREKDRAAMKADYDKKMLKEAGVWHGERLNLLSKTKELERRLEAKTANELGDGAEVDIYENLKAEWDDEGDKIRRTRKGEEGADILHEVRYKGEVCGRILIESKNRQKWLNEDTSKLHEDMIEAGADHGILAASKFPAAKHEMFMQDGVLVMKPVEVVEIVRVLRGSLVRMYSLKLSNTERAEKTAKLYQYINSPDYKQKLTPWIT